MPNPYSHIINGLQGEIISPDIRGMPQLASDGVEYARYHRAGVLPPGAAHQHTPPPSVDSRSLNSVIAHSRQDNGFIEAIPRPTVKAAYAPPVFQTFQDRKRAKEAALRVQMGQSFVTPNHEPGSHTTAHGLQNGYPALVSSPQRAPLPIPVPGPASSTSAQRPLPQPGVSSPIRSNPTISPSTPPSYRGGPSPFNATLERSDTISSVRSLDHQFSSPTRRPLPKPPVGVNSSRSLDRGMPSDRRSPVRKYPSTVQEDAEDGISSGMTMMALSGRSSPSRSPASSRPSSTYETRSRESSSPASRSNTTFDPVTPQRDGTPLINVADHDSTPTSRSSPRRGSPGIVFAGLPTISVSSQDDADAGSSIVVPSINLPDSPKSPSHRPTPYAQAGPSRIQPTSAIICAQCNHPIIGRIVNAMKERWHPACFMCAECGELLEHVSSYEYEGKAYCHLDYHDVSGPTAKDLGRN